MQACPRGIIAHKSSGSSTAACAPLSSFSLYYEASARACVARQREIGRGKIRGSAGLCRAMRGVRWLSLSLPFSLSLSVWPHAIKWNDNAKRHLEHHIRRKDSHRNVRVRPLLGPSLTRISSYGRVVELIHFRAPFYAAFSILLCSSSFSILNTHMARY